MFVQHPPGKHPYVTIVKIAEFIIQPLSQNPPFTLFTQRVKVRYSDSFFPQSEALSIYRYTYYNLMFIVIIMQLMPISIRRHNTYYCHKRENSISYLIHFEELINKPKPHLFAHPQYFFCLLRREFLWH